MIFEFYFTGGLTPIIDNGKPIFGTDGATLVPEPASLLLLGSGLLGLGVLRKRKFKG